MRGPSLLMIEGVSGFREWELAEIKKDFLKNRIFLNEKIRVGLHVINDHIGFSFAWSPRYLHGQADH